MQLIAQPHATTSKFRGVNVAERPSVRVVQFRAASQHVHRRVRLAAVEETAAYSQTITTTTAVTQGNKIRVSALKLRLLSTIASLDRGLAANGVDARRVDQLVRLLESSAGPVSLTWGKPGPDGASTLDLLQGTWRLLYTSGFNTGSLGGTRPGPPAALVPTTLGQVYQRIDSQSARLDNTVEFLLISPFPTLSNLLGSIPAALSGTRGSSSLPTTPDYPDSPVVKLTLKHTYELKGERTVEIVFEDTTAELLGVEPFPQDLRFDVPQLPDALKPPRNIRSASFDVVFLDEQMRVTRGDRNELRVYVRDDNGSAAADDLE